MRIRSFLFAAGVFFLIGCSGGGKTVEEKPEIKLNNRTTAKEIDASRTDASRTDAFSYLTADLESKGIGPITALNLKRRINKDLADEGKAVYTRLCTACHRTDKKFIGPEMKGLLDRRTPEWVMNTLLDPEGMIEKDSLTMKIFKEFNNVIMPNQNPTEEEARAMLEYFRTLK
ncbi:MAG: cytochrome c [Flavobacteriaceae bacterium]|nr:cytochrome c [Bacteroidia bacterium]NNK88695.1 cytochrome c [Flavobacteriaceae bacterium]